MRVLIVKAAITKHVFLLARPLICGKVRVAVVHICSSKSLSAVWYQSVKHTRLGQVLNGPPINHFRINAARKIKHVLIKTVFFSLLNGTSDKTITLYFPVVSVSLTKAY